jgi:NAD(P)H-flavin reductase
LLARVAEKREVAKGTLLVLFDLLGEEVEFTPGQYFFVTLLDPPYEDERGARRHFSVVTSPNERGRLLLHALARLRIQALAGRASGRSRGRARRTEGELLASSSC